MLEILQMYENYLYGLECYIYNSVQTNDYKIEIVT